MQRSQTARILAAAIALFGDQGYAETTVAQIADRAGVSRRTVYDLYTSKEAVFLHTYRCTQLLMVEAGSRDVSLDKGNERSVLTAQTLSSAVARLLSIVAASPPAARMFFLEATGAGQLIRTRRNDAIAEFVTTIAPRLQQLRAETEPTLPPLSFALCNAIVAASIELIVQHLAAHRPESVTNLTDAITDLVRAIVTPHH
ncbi:TetR/AcrR family transcriptional regulator [Mycobacterium paragordonae]|uniref:Helix-turn-helix domain-containing protein n=1 Tax=Mycobacterium paragordonae TaxID=1389713 RepID=A0AAJ1W6W5_9MYCO|nr:TetR/AcrR family transcriptional regulator [Mycobacterium paragordonae]MDP7739593.1 helix-turn-helix domain-containing protein [Mycobacterium paragordonae]